MTFRRSIPDPLPGSEHPKRAEITRRLTASGCGPLSVTTSISAGHEAPWGHNDSVLMRPEGVSAPSVPPRVHRPSLLDRALARPRGFFIAGDLSWNVTTLCALMLVAALVVSAAIVRDEKEAAAELAQCREVLATDACLCWRPEAP